MERNYHPPMLGPLTKK